MIVNGHNADGSGRRVYRGRDRWHFENNGWYACNGTELPAKPAVLSPNEAPVNERCSRGGCVEHWPTDHDQTQVPTAPTVLDQSPRRPSDERVVAQSLGGALGHLGNVGHDYAEYADAAKDVLTAAARAEAAYRTAKAKAKLRYRAEGAKSDAEAETKADADDHIADLLMDRLIKQAEAAAHLEKLRQLRARNENGRTYASTERELDRMHAQGRAGAA